MQKQTDRYSIRKLTEREEKRREKKREREEQVRERERERKESVKEIDRRKVIKIGPACSLLTSSQGMLACCVSFEAHRLLCTESDNCRHSKTDLVQIYKVKYHFKGIFRSPI